MIDQLNQSARVVLDTIGDRESVSAVNLAAIEIRQRIERQVGTVAVRRSARKIDFVARSENVVLMKFWPVSPGFRIERCRAAVRSGQRDCQVAVIRDDQVSG